MDVLISRKSTWGRSSKQYDIRALRGYNRLLRTLAQVGEIAVFTLAPLAVVGVLWFTFTGDFEHVLFTDGTALSCMLDGVTGSITDAK